MRQGFHGHVGAKVVTLRAELLYFRGVKAEWVRWGQAISQEASRQRASSEDIGGGVSHHTVHIHCPHKNIFPMEA